MEKISVAHFRCTTQMGAIESAERAPGAAPRARSGRGFSLIEVLLAIFILGIGMIMVASVFPVGANWTRQAAEDSVGQMVAQMAETVIRKHYGPGGDMTYFGLNTPVIGSSNTILNSTNASPFQLQALPFFTRIPANERAFQFGANNPFPAANPTACTYFWTALARLNPMHVNLTAPPNDPLHGILPSTTYTYDLYILVFRKGSAENTFSNKITTPTGATEVLGLRNLNSVGNRPAELYMPSVFYAPYGKGTYSAGTSPAVSGAVPAMGGIGIGRDSGTVFRQILDTSSGAPGGATPRPLLRGQTSPTTPPVEPIIYSAPADGAQVSPLIYVYQTTVSF
jgi:prepilin-type N-terminal cleavage/methylation domain-containing protein